MGEFSPKNWKVEGGVEWAILSAACLIALPSILSYLLRVGFANHLTDNDARTLSTLILYALVMGLLVSVNMFLYGCYRKGTRPRLVFGLVSVAIISVYSFIVLVASGLDSVLYTIGLRLDTVFAALMIAYASMILLFSVLGEHAGARGRPPESPKPVPQAQGGAK